MKAPFKLIAQHNSQAHSYEPRFAGLLFSPQYRYSPDYYYTWSGEFYVCTNMAKLWKSCFGNSEM
jgi:hypothetical protein